MIDPVAHNGKVVDQNRIPLMAAHVVLNDPRFPKGTITDFNGNFKITGVSGEIYKISHIGNSAEYFTLQPNMQPKTYVLTENNIELDEVVVTGKKKQENLWGLLVGVAALVFVGTKIFKT